ncbi:nucleoside 2-deoxyribosyltransferase [Methanofollis fontis]|uniref:Nucleoside 2-deoxyribosyltransferase n=1 Tax=Methanofollis fontis TaxID=2052832 RepID=A0A483CQT7_9EURY|nr:nucleoside 2-deoxyribosyltransferase [Methanofollis fontis]TAJ45483.1 nucleoside 2-deoxyribosyltransferase [Methanofollis fontis]
MYILCSPCICDPSLRAEGITRPADLTAFEGALERCRRFSIEVVPLPCPETAYLGRPRPPATFAERLDTPAFSVLLDRMEAEVRSLIAERGPPLCIVGVDSSPTCGVNRTWRDDRVPGRGAFLARFPEIEAVDVYEFARHRVYCAAPLFTAAEQGFNREVRDLLEASYYDVYLPQEAGEDGAVRDPAWGRALFDRHTAALRRADVVVGVIDGADADSGTAWEMGYAYALGKPVVALRTDFRRVGSHELVNLMLEHSASVVTAVGDLPDAVGRACMPVYVRENSS